MDPFGTSAELSKSEAWHTLLDMGGMASPIFDFVNGAWYVYTGDWGNAAWSTFAIIPIAGDLSKAPKVGKDAKIIGEVIDAAKGTEKVDILSNKSLTNETSKVYNYVSPSNGFDAAKSDFDALVTRVTRGRFSCHASWNSGETGG